MATRKKTPDPTAAELTVDQILGGSDPVVEEAPAAWTWSGLFESIVKNWVPTVKQSLVTAVLGALVAYGTILYKDMKSAETGAAQVGSALSTAGRDKVEPSEATAAPDATIDAIAAVCAVKFSEAFKSACKPGKKG